MSAITVVLLLVLAAIGTFVAVNWSLFLAPATLSLVVATVEAPLGLILLGLMGVLTAVFLVVLVALQTRVLLEARRHARELKTQRDLADQAEASRFTELRQYIAGEFRTLEERLGARAPDRSGDRPADRLGNRP